MAETLVTSGKKIFTNWQDMPLLARKLHALFLVLVDLKILPILTGILQTKILYDRVLLWTVKPAPVLGDLAVGFWGWLAYVWHAILIGESQKHHDNAPPPAFSVNSRLGSLCFRGAFSHSATQTETSHGDVLAEGLAWAWHNR